MMLSDVDLWVFRWINSAAGSFPALDAVMLILAEGSPAGALVLLGYLWFWPGHGRGERRRYAVWVVLAALLSLGLSDLPGWLYYRPRPFVAHEVNLLVQGVPTPSFPASHLAGTAAIGTVVAGRSCALTYLVWLAVLGGMYARVYIGVHYPSDVLAGAFLGWVAGALVHCNQDVLQAFADRIVKGIEELL